MIKILGLAVAVLTAGGAATDERPEIRFGHGAIDATLSSSVVRGDRDIYPINAAAGQTMTVEITSLEDNAVFQVFPPGTHYMQNPDDIWVFHGEALRGAEGDTVRWSGQLASGGQYLIVVGGTRGNADYRLHVTID